MKKILFILLISICSSWLNGQSVGINEANPHSSALLDVKAKNNHISWTLPKIALTDIFDKNVIVGANPAEALLIYNTNPNVPAGKGIYYWSANDNKWQFVVNQHSIDLFRDLTRYYTKDTEYPTTVSTTASGTTQYTLDSGTAGWTMIKDTGGVTLEVPVTIDQAVNFLDINLSGTWLTHSDSNDTNVNRGFEVAYGVFIDGLLKYVKIDSKLALNPCNINNFYVNSIIPNVATGVDRKLSFGVQLRRVQGNDNNTGSFPNNTTLKIGGASPTSGATRGCKNANAFENTTKATVFVNQTL